MNLETTIENTASALGCLAPFSESKKESSKGSCRLEKQGPLLEKGGTCSLYSH